MQFLDGKKTYIVAALFLAANVAYILGYVDVETVAKIDAVLAPFGLAFLRAGVK